MEGTHLININVPDHLTECILHIQDFSKYNSLLPIANPTLQIQVPGFKTCLEFTLLTTPQVDGGFDLKLNACDLDLQNENCGLQQYPLPDGIYNIQYSVAPNEYVYDEVNHLRVTKLRLAIYKVYSSLNLGPTEPTPDVDAKLKVLLLAEQSIEAAKAAILIEKDCEKAMMLYGYAKELVDKLTCKNC